MSPDDVDDLISEHGLREASRIMGTDGRNATKAPTDEERKAEFAAWLETRQGQHMAAALRKVMERMR
jgi:hypothetical protein